MLQLIILIFNKNIVFYLILAVNPILSFHIKIF